MLELARPMDGIDGRMQSGGITSPCNRALSATSLLTTLLFEHWRLCYPLHSRLVKSIVSTSVYLRGPQSGSATATVMWKVINLVHIPWKYTSDYWQLILFFVYVYIFNPFDGYILSRPWPVISDFELWASSGELVADGHIVFVGSPLPVKCLVVLCPPDVYGFSETEHCHEFFFIEPFVYAFVMHLSFLPEYRNTFFRIPYNFDSGSSSTELLGRDCIAYICLQFRMLQLRFQTFVS